MPSRKGLESVRTGSSQKFYIYNFETVNFDHPSLIPANHWSEALNMVRGIDGLWENRKGIKSFSEAIGSDEPAHSLHFWETSTGNKYLTVGSGTKIYSYDTSADEFEGSFTERQAGFTDGAKFDFTQYKNILVVTNGEENMYSTVDNATFTIRNGADTIKAKYIIAANDIIYAGGVPSNESELYASDAAPTVPYEFPNSVEVESDNGQNISGLTNLGPIVIVGKEKSMYDVDVVNLNRNQLNYSGGVESHRSIVRANRSVYFASNQGFISLAERISTTGALDPNSMSDPIKSLWNLLRNKSEIPAIFFPKTEEILMTVETAEQIYTLVFNVKWQSWSYFVGVNAADFTLYEDVDGMDRLIYGDSSGDRIKELYVNRDDDGAPINSAVSTASLDFGTDQLKTCNYLELAGYASEGFELIVEIFLDEQTLPTKTYIINGDNFAAVPQEIGVGELGGDALNNLALGGAVNFGGDLDVFYWVRRLEFEETFRTMRVRVSNAQKGVRWRFKSIIIDIDTTAKGYITEASQAND